MRDPLRVTRRTDIAFWLHLLAAPLIVHALIVSLFGPGRLPDAATAVRILAAFFGLGVIAVLIDRRALLVSGLAYAGIAVGTLLNRSALADMTVPATVLVLGAFILLLSAFWRPVRRGFLILVPARLRARLPNPARPNGS
jgi:hypothetical protein